MPGFGRLLGRRAGPVGVALTLYDIWRRLPAKQRRRLIEHARTHGPRIAKQAYEARRRPPRR
jgi:hypothetical protein